MNASPITPANATPQPAAPIERPTVQTPADLFQELFVAVQRSQVFDDSKTFVDCAPLHAPGAILADYRAQQGAAGFDLKAFVDRNFHSDVPPRSTYESECGQPLQQHIDSLWPVLTRQPSAHPPRCSLLPLPKPYVVPGGRFAELYYWDSYFTMVGLGCGKDMAGLRDMLDNFAFLIDTYGHVPNGTRTYYVGRSQPPLFAAMVMLAEQHGVANAVDFLPQLQAEHAWWMTDEDTVPAGDASRRVVRLVSGEILNRYWDERDTPREESWLEDMATAEACSHRAPGDLFRDLRAACESGWDFSSRWLREPDAGAASAPAAAADSGAASVKASCPRAGSAASLATICTTDLVPVDLNALLYQLETTVSALAERAGDLPLAEAFTARAQRRQAALNRHLWNESAGAYFDFDWRHNTLRTCLTGATVAPLFAGLATRKHADALAATVRNRLLAPGGFATSEYASEQQWDRPNGWAPLQYMAVRGLAHHGHHALAADIAGRWLATVAAVYEREGKLVEKYALRQREGDHSAGGAGGEYPLQDGFGWTNGVTCALLAAYPQHSAHGCTAHTGAPRHR